MGVGSIGVESTNQEAPIGRLSLLTATRIANCDLGKAQHQTALLEHL